jgi:hypothetical protein
VSAYDSPMASWTDGPEYAPSVRPAAFVAPVAEALASPPPPTGPTEAPPNSEPTFVPPQDPAPDLRELVPSSAPGRNPNLPFESMTTPITAVEPVVERQPDQPFNAPGPTLTGYLPVQPVVQPNTQINPMPFPAPGTTQWFAPPPGQPVIAAPSSVDLGQIWRATTNWVMVPLLAAMFIPPISPVALLVAWLSTVQIRYRRTAVRRAYLIAIILIGGISLVTTLTDQSVSIWDPLTITSTVAAWVLAFLTPGIVGIALRNNEPPDRL